MELYLNKHGFEKCFDHWGEAVETYEATPLKDGLFRGNKRQMDGQTTQSIYAYVGGISEQKPVHIGTLNHTQEYYSHTHGYYPEHPIGIKFKAFAESEGFTLR